jgi:hypothetical protein
MCTKTSDDFSLANPDNPRWIALVPNHVNAVGVDLREVDRFERAPTLPIAAFYPSY